MEKLMARRNIEWWQPQLGETELGRVTEVLASNYLNDGAVTETFEVELAKRLNVKHVVTTTSGTTALYLALKAVGIGHGDEVIVPDITFIASANAVSMTGATPVLVDVDSTTLNICPAAIEMAITSRTRAIMPVHISGRAADMHSIGKIAASRDLHVVEDAAEALLSFHEGKALGTFGIMGCFSLSPNKTISTGQGGFIATNDSTAHRKLRQLKDQGRPVKGTGGDDIHPALGFNFKYTNLQAAVGLGQLELLDKRVEHLRATYIRYRDRLANVPGIRVLTCHAEAGETPQWTDVIVENRDELCSFLTSEKIGFRRFWHPLHTQEPYHQPDANFPNSSKLSPKAMWLPSCFDMTEEDVDYVATTIEAFMRRAVEAAR
jgi:perosamine synthetase